jgi:hypothetical protein
MELPRSCIAQRKLSGSDAEVGAVGRNVAALDQRPQPREGEQIVRAVDDVRLLKPREIVRPGEFALRTDGFRSGRHDAHPIADEVAGRQRRGLLGKRFDPAAMGVAEHDNVLDLERGDAELQRRRNAMGALVGPGAPFRALRDQFEEYRSAGSCTLIGGGTTSVDQAALYNSGLVRYVDLLDSYMSPGGLCHPSDNFGAVLASAEHANANGEDFLLALAVAYEVQCRFTAVVPVMAKGFNHALQLAMSVALASVLASSGKSSGKSRDCSRPIARGGCERE